MHHGSNADNCSSESRSISPEPHRSRDPVLLIAAALALLWLLFSCCAMAERITGVPTDRSTDALVAQLGAAVEMVMIVPYFIFAVLAVIFSWLAWRLNRRGIALTAAILLCLSVVLGLKNGVGLLPGAVMEFIGASRLKRRRFARQ